MMMMMVSRVRRHVDYLSSPGPDNHKCALKHDHLPRINYAGGSTYTRGAMLEAEVLIAGRSSRFPL